MHLEVRSCEGLAANSREHGAQQLCRSLKGEQHALVRPHTGHEPHLALQPGHGVSLLHCAEANNIGGAVRKYHETRAETGCTFLKGFPDCLHLPALLLLCSRRQACRKGSGFCEGTQ